MIFFYPKGKLRTLMSLAFASLSTVVGAEGWDGFETRCLKPLNDNIEVVTDRLNPVELDPMPFDAQFGFGTDDENSYLGFWNGPNGEVISCLFVILSDLDNAQADFENWRDEALNAGTHSEPGLAMRAILGSDKDAVVVNPGTEARATVIVERALYTDPETKEETRFTSFWATLRFQE